MVNDRLNESVTVGSSYRSVPSDNAAHRRATRIAFGLVGIGMAAWAPLVPYAKARLGIDDATLGGLLLCLGIGSLAAMPGAGFLAGRFGCRSVMSVATLGLCAALPGLASANNVVVLGAILLGFGAALGVFDVAVNVQAVRVEKASGRAIMSGFHAFFSLGGMFGAGGVSLLLWLGESPLTASIAALCVCLIALVAAAPGLLPKSERRQVAKGGARFVRPTGLVLAIGSLCFVAFLVEGAMLDWSGVFLVTFGGMSSAAAGLGYATFSVAMTLGRMTGDRVVRKFGPHPVLVGSALCAMCGLFWVVFIARGWESLAGFALVGFGSANIVPILYSALGRQRVMPPNLAISAAATLGYAGILAGPALIGAIARFYSLGIAYLLVAGLLLCIATSAGRILRA
jgi:predicted MFS family arabinose efflux permease